MTEEALPIGEAVASHAFTFTKPSFSVPTHGNTGNAKLWQRVLAMEFVLAFGVHWVREFLDPDSDANTRGVADIDRTLSIMAVYFVLAVAAQGQLAKGCAALGGIIAANIIFTHRDFLMAAGGALKGGISANPEDDNSGNQVEFVSDVQNVFNAGGSPVPVTPVTNAPVARGSLKGGVVGNAPTVSNPLPEIAPNP